ncbi:MAG: hypothetical protein LUQ71_10130 [Methanoregula sp.]|nr:hypothetical protein [Methanoregula sp.]
MKSPARILPAVLVLLAILCLPVAAIDNTTVLHAVEIRQAHLAWTALDTDVGMNAAVTYCGTLYGVDTSGMSALLAQFRKEEALIKSAATGDDVDVLIADMKNTTGQFREETVAVMTKGQGKWDALNLQILTVKDNNPYILEKKDTYWTVRKADELADFDAWVRDGQQKLDTLKTRGYDITTAQRALDVLSSKRPEVLSALNSKTELAVQVINPQILSLSEEFVRKLAAVQEQVPDSLRLKFLLDQTDRSVGLADRVNIDLVPFMIDIGEADPVLSKTKTDLADSRKILNTGNLGSAKIQMRIVQKDIVDLAQAYRDVAHSVALPADLSAELNSLVLRLEDAADQLGAAL